MVRKPTRSTPVSPRAARWTASAARSACASTARASRSSTTPTAVGDTPRLLRFSTAGDRVVATARRPETLDDLVASAPDRVLVLPLDVTDVGQIGAAVAAARSHCGRIDVLVNNAGYGSVGAVEELDDGELRTLMDTMFFGAVALTRTVLPVPMDGAQPGDPAKAAAAILGALDSDATPLRLALGDDAVGAIADALDRRRSDLEAWEAVSRGTALAG